jgi:hypothetical protein
VEWSGIGSNELLNLLDFLVGQLRSMKKQKFMERELHIYSPAGRGLDPMNEENFDSYLNSKIM